MFNQQFMLMKKIFFSLIVCLFVVVSAMAQRTVSGKVTDDSGDGLPGVNVVIKGTTTGTTTDLDGNYRVTVNDDDVLVFSFVGFETQELNVGARTVVDLSMSGVTELQEVIVTAFGVEKEAKALGYAVTEIQNEEITKARQTSILNSLQGKVAGASITSSGGAIGASTRVVLRGPTSFLNNNQALFVVDGIPINNSANNNVQSSGNFYDNVVDGGNRANDINPEDIESISVLKGPAAAALYGSRAANGVILITTKKGSSDPNKGMEITLNSNYSWQQVYAFPRMQNRFGQGQFGDNQNYLFDQESWGDAFDGSLRPYGAIVNNVQRYKPYVAQPTNYEDFWEIGKTSQNSISLSGGNETSTYYLSFGDLQQSGVLLNTNLHRNNFTMNGSTKLSNKVTSSASINYVRTDARLPQTGQRNQAVGQIVSLPRDYSFVDMQDLSDPFNTPDGFFTSFVVNPYYSLLHDFSDQKLNRVYGNFQLTYNPIEWITVTSRVGTDVSSDQRNTFHDVVEYAPGSPNSGAAFNADGEYTEQTINNREINADFLISGTRQITSDLEGTLLVGYNFNQRSRDILSITAPALTIPGFASLSNASGAVLYSSTNGGAIADPNFKRRLYGLYTSLDLNYKGFLFLGATYRNDWSSTLPLDNNSFGYPGVNLGFVVTDAFDLGIDNILSFAKVRASYAEVGNDAGLYLTNSVFVQSSITSSFATLQFPFNNGTTTVTGFSEGNRIGNPTLQPEITTSTEIGVDLRFLNGKIKVDATYYDASSESQIITAALPASTGFTTQVLNIGKMTNKGVELMIGGTARFGQVTWDISANYTKNKNNVESIQDGVTELTILAQGLTPGLKIVEGQPYGVFEATQVLRDPNGNIVVDGTGMPVDDPDPVLVGNIQPDWTGGLTSTIAWRGLSLSTTFETRQGGSFVSSTAAQMYFNGIAEETAFNDREDWIIPGSVQQTGTESDGVTPIYTPNTVPLDMAHNGTVRTYWSNIQGGSRNTEVMFDASFIKLREVSLAYDIPRQLLDSTPIGSATISFIGRNLWLHTAADNHFVDPEASAFGSNSNIQGYEFIGIPTQASYGFNLRFTL